MNDRAALSVSGSGAWPMARQRGDLRLKTAAKANPVAPPLVSVRFERRVRLTTTGRRPGADNREAEAWQALHGRFDSPTWSGCLILIASELELQEPRHAAQEFARNLLASRRP